MNQDFILAFRNVSKSFGAVRAADDLSLQIRKGSIHAIVGENGAGKSTAMNLLYGMMQPDSGDILIDGKVEKINTPQHARSLGIGMVFQHFMLAAPYTVLEHLRLQFHPLKQSEIIERANKTLELAKIDINLNSKIEDLSVGLQQRVEILKSLMGNPRILILDEPTAVLTPQETQHLFASLRSMRDQGTTIVFISHKLDEVMNLCDTISIIRAGKVIDTCLASETSKGQLAEKMVGRCVPSVLNNQVASKNSKAIFKDEHCEIFAGEILGIAGVDGNGQAEFIENVVKSSKRCAMMPRDRLHEGVILDGNLNENFLLGYHDEEDYDHFVIDHSKVASTTRALMDAFEVQPKNQNLLMRNLSGGNQQKFVMARELSKNSSLIVCAEPTRGVDIGAIQLIHQKILETRAAGAAVLLVSTQLEEILALSDRVIVMFRGKMSKPLLRSECTAEKIGLLMAGVGL